MKLKTLMQFVLTMAFSNQTGDYMEEFICPVCLELLNDPVILECGHNYCRTCIDSVWDSAKQPSCPECREKCPTKKYTVNRLLANVIQKAQTQGQKGESSDVQRKGCDHICREHEEILKLFCQEDETLACLLCVPEHPGHSFLTVQKAASIYKENLTVSLSRLQSSLKHFKEIESQQEMKISEITANAKSLQLHIVSEFGKLHKFLQEKEENLVRQLYKEERKILREMEINLRKIRESINVTQDSISNIQQQLQQPYEITFLKEIKSFSERLTKSKKEGDSQSVVDPGLSLGVYRGPLQYNAWKEMKSLLNPGVSNLSLDTKTAHSSLIISRDMTSVGFGDKCQQLPDNPQRFNCSIAVLGSEGFTLGRHYWEVKVKKKTDWYVGVTKESSNRKGKLSFSPKDGYWIVSLKSENEYKVWDSPSKVLSMSVKPQRIGVHLDYEGGQLSFYSADNMSHLYTFTGPFTEKLYPFFSPGLNNGGKNAEPLKIFNLKM